MGPWITLASYGCEELLKTQVEYMSVMITVLVTVLALLGLFIPIWNIDRMEKLKEKTAAEIDELKEEIEETKTKLQEDFKNKTDELIQNEKEIELKLQYRTIVLLKNHIISNSFLYKDNDDNDRWIVISYIMFYQIMTAALILLKNKNFQKVTAKIIINCFNSINNEKPMIEIYDNINKWSYKKIYDQILGGYRDLFDSKFIEFLEKVKRKEEEKYSASEEE